MEAHAGQNEYGIKQLAGLAGVTTRTLRWYDRLGLLCPVRKDNGYRVYGAREVDRLQQILFYKELGMPLDEIGGLLDAQDFDAGEALRQHLKALRDKRARLDALIETVARTLAAQTKGEPMSDAEKFEAFKQNALEKNEKTYGAEIREAYGDEAVDASNERFGQMTKEQHQEMEALTKQIAALLKEAVAQGDPTSELAHRLAEAHKRWLLYFWPTYSPEQHKGVTQMYVDDARFTQYYEDIVPGGAHFLRNAVWSWLG